MNLIGRVLLILLHLLLASYSNGYAADADLNLIERQIVKEPQYEMVPRYLLLAFGPQAETRVWIVEDGKKLYVDKNANGDMTDDGPPIEPTDFEEWQESVDSSVKSWSCDYPLVEFTPPGRPVQKDFHMRRWNYDGRDEDNFGLSVTFDGEIPMYAGWFGSFWRATPSEASIIHIGGPLTPGVLRFKEFVLGTDMPRVSLFFTNPGLGEAATSRLSIDALRADVNPILHIQWPSKEGDTPLVTDLPLDQRCCYWEFYTTHFRVPEGAAEGTARVTVELPLGSLRLSLTTNEVEVPVVAAAAVTPSE